MEDAYRLNRGKIQCHYHMSNTFKLTYALSLNLCQTINQFQCKSNQSPGIPTNPLIIHDAQTPYISQNSGQIGHGLTNGIPILDQAEDVCPCNAMWSASSLNGGLILYLNWNTNIQSHAFQINTNIMSLKLVICHPDQSFVKQTKSCTSFPLYYRSYPTIQPSERTDWSVVCQPSSIRRQSSTNRRTVARITGELVNCVDRLQSHWGTN